MVQNKHLKFTKEQLEFHRIDNEYEFVKKRALINFLTNAKMTAEANFYSRATTMLKSIQSFEQANLKSTLRGIADGSTEKVLGLIDNPEHSATIKRASFDSALDGIRNGVMTYNGDALLPMI